MLFEIENYNIKNSSEEQTRALQNLLRSHHDKQNIILGPISLFEYIISAEDTFSRIERIAANQIKDTIREYANIKKDLCHYVIVDFNHSGIDVQESLGKKTIRTGWMKYIKDCDCTSPYFIAEDDNDHAFFLKIAEYVLKKKGLKIKVNFELQSGAGSHTFKRFKDLRASKNFVICFVDSDRIHPKAKEGSTSSKFPKSLRETVKNSFCKVIDAREIESLIPTAVIRSVVQDKMQDKVSVLDDFIKLCESNSDFRSFFDHKEGISICNAHECDQMYGEFWIPILASIPEIANCDCIHLKNNQDHVCKKVYGFGENLLALTNSFLNETNIMQLNKLLDANLVDLWNELGSYLISWGCTLNHPKNRC